MSQKAKPQIFYSVFQKTQTDNNLKSTTQNLQNLSSYNVYDLKVQSLFFLMICSLDTLMGLFIIK